ncbi:uncharacterized protein CCOS01_10752 [Colletotrichum costaricense]|uniref:Uncharacterized protein n=2 Tax=Colletotrichum acutatum species complex TaxID=2707335 RepID=A0AAI9YSG7_9PEZI|nr:uncharacterized protein CCOS01_10752 [Colletotrichum costaricense]XP_060380830.1 uncharacterized protein CTAM01_08591 [Colletotrichum tamarilloi]KAK1495462.1 hypothetical protein CTAM01_08591 [Colletotrichum tamarilloi]KAK1520633.1 hypothetical protein CCOS01_10752 [Colletotrichum costaricense]
MKQRDGGAAHPFDAAVIPRRLTRRRCLLEEFWKPSPLGLASISWLHARATRPPHALNFAPAQRAALRVVESWDMKVVAKQTVPAS